MRDGGLADRKPGMLVGINQGNTNSLFTENGGEQRTREAIAEYSYIKIVFGFLYDRSITPDRLVLNQGRSPGESCAVGREHNEIAIFDTPSVERIHVADHHIGFL